MSAPSIGRVQAGDAVELAELQQVEREAATLFADADVPAAVRESVTSLDDLGHARAAGLLWVARDAGRVIGFALVGFNDGLPHLMEIDVRPSYARRGVGRALLAAVLDWARGAGHRALTLTTFRHVAWNAPFYARLGFRILAPTELTPGLAGLLRNEAARGLDPARRVAMRRELEGD